MTLLEFLAPSYLQMLGALSGWLEKAEKSDGADALTGARLAEDMFPLATQVRFACVQALEGMHRLRDEEFPPQVAALLDEGRMAGDAPGTLADARARLAETLDAVRDLASGPVPDDPDRTVAHAIPAGMVFDLTAGQYVRDWALPQFYFHVMTAYAILRANGVELGKADYVAHMFAYLRPGTMPGESETA